MRSLCVVYSKADAPPLNNLNNGWALKNKVWSGYSQPLWFDSIPLVFNSNNFSQGGNTAALDFIVTSNVGFDTPYNGNTQNYAATALSFGDGTNNYGFETNATMVYTTATGKTRRIF